MEVGYRWVPGTEQILEIGYRWVPGTEQILKVGYRWVLGTEQILEVGYRWVPGTEQILEIGYRWVPGTEQILEVGYRWVPVTEQILEDKSFIFKFECLYNNFNLVKLFGATILGNLYISGIASNAEFLSPLQIPASTGLRFEENSEDFLAGGPVLLEMEKNFKENSKPEFVTSFDINTVVTSRASSKKARLKVA